MNKIIMLISLVNLGLVAGCNKAQDDAFVGSGTDQLPQSACQACDKEPFYKAGQWIAR